MKFQRVISGLALPSFIVGLAIIVSSCRPMVTQEQLKELKELRQQERSLTEQINTQKAENKKIKNEIDARKGELKKCNDNSEFVKQKLSQWPNSWPDWKPEQEKENSEEGNK